MAKLFCTIFLILITPLSFADNHVRFSGFGTLGVTLNDSSHYGYRNDISFDNAVFKVDIDFKTASLLAGETISSETFAESFAEIKNARKVFTEKDLLGTWKCEGFKS